MGLLLDIHTAKLNRSQNLFLGFGMSKCFFLQLIHTQSMAYSQVQKDLVSNQCSLNPVDGLCNLGDADVALDASFSVVAPKYDSLPTQAFLDTFASESSAAVEAANMCQEGGGYLYGQGYSAACFFGAENKPDSAFEQADDLCESYQISDRTQCMQADSSSLRGPTKAGRSVTTPQNALCMHALSSGRFAGKHVTAQGVVADAFCGGDDGYSKRPSQRPVEEAPAKDKKAAKKAAKKAL
jgi:hypothetical protein